MKLSFNTIFRKKSYRCKPVSNPLNFLHIQKCYRSYLTKSVFISESKNIFVNLALEDWFYQNYDFSNHHILLLWKNTNCVVIGRHQNPWLEANLKENDDTVLARRNSGGGAVYHDTENLNLTFFTSFKAYNRRHNLEIIKDSLQKEWDIKCEINSREDIVYNGFKISGTASKLGRKNAYHHCTVLVDSNKKSLSAMLHDMKKNICTRATRSTPAPILNLRELNPTANIDRLMTIVGLKYLETIPVIKSQTVDFIERKGFSFVSPEERFFPGLHKRIQEFESWKWRFGMTPKFTLKSLIMLSEILVNFSSDENIEMEIEVDAGVIKNILLIVPSSFLVFVTNDMLDEITSPFIQNKYNESLFLDVKRKVINFFRDKIDQRLYCIL